MIDISAREAKMLRDRGRSDDVHLSSRSHNSSHKSYFLTTSPKSMRILNEYRKSHVLETHNGR